MKYDNILKISKKYYEEKYENGEYTKIETPQEHRQYERLKNFIVRNALYSTAVALEIGSGKGLFQDLLENYVGLDVSETLRKYYRENNSYVVGTGNNLPFEENSFDFIFSIHALEHIPSPEDVLSEIRRTIRNGGLIYLAPAWQCRPWAADGYSVRPYSDFDLRGKLTKAIIPLRNSVFWRALFIFPKRLFYLARFLVTGKHTKLWYKTLKPNYEMKWTSDSDAINSMDPFSVILWFISRGDKCINYPRLLGAFFVRTGELILRTHKL